MNTGASGEMELAWETFVNSGKIREGIVDASIAQSWLKCIRQGVNPTDGRGRVEDGRDMLRDLREKNERVIRIAKPFMQNLYGFFRNSGFIVVLADAQGYILENFGDPGCMENAQYLNFIPGANWSELRVGTNAVGIVLANGTPGQISGHEHFCRRHHCWTCSAAPIRDHHGRIVAVLDISGPSQAAYSHTLGMVVAAAEAIAMQLKLEQHNQRGLASQSMNRVFNIMSEGIIMLDQYGLVNNINGTAQKLFKATASEVLGRPVETAFNAIAPLARTILEKKESCAGVQITIPAPGGAKPCMVSGEPFADEQGDAGGIIILHPLKNPSPAGHYAAFRFEDIIGRSPSLREAVRTATLAASGSANILLQGESGTGKEMFAQAIHQQSPRRDGPFVAVNCGAIPRDLVGSELFGYDDGAFTGARRGGRTGKFELAAGGTLFLDEIGDMPLEQQVTLLRALQEKKITRLGGNKAITTDVRIVCASNRNLLQAVEQGAFRQDLYYRLNVISIAIPPLRQRGEDCLLLFGHFLRLAGREKGREFQVDEAVLEKLKRYSWPGNVREVHNLAERIASLAEDHTVSLAYLPAEFTECKRENLLPLGSSLFFKERRQRQIATAEREVLLALLDECGGNISQVAKKLGVARTTIYRKIRLYHLGGAEV